MTTTELVREIVEEYFHLTPGTLNIKSRKREIVKARQLAHYFAYTLNGDSSTMVGQGIGNKDHATVLHSMKIVKNAMSTDYRGRVYDPELCKVIARLRLKIEKELVNADLRWCNNVSQL